MMSYSTSLPPQQHHILIACCIFIFAALINLQPYHSVVSTCTSSNCSIRGWLTDLQQEATALQCTVSKLEKSISILNSTNSTQQQLALRVSQLNKVKSALNNINLEIQIIGDKCNNFDGQDCNISRALNITGEFMYINFDGGSPVDKYGIPLQPSSVEYSDASPRKPHYGKYAVFDKIRGADIATISPTWVSFGTGKSLSIWIRKLPNTEYGVIWSFLRSTDPPLIQHTGGNAQDLIDLWTLNSGHVSPSVKIPDNEWHHIAVVCKSNGIDMYIDGALSSSTPTPFPPTLDNIALGSINHKSFFNGHMDEFRMFNVELTAAQVQQIYNY